MSIFGFGKKKNNESKTTDNNKIIDVKSVKVLGTGCKACHTLLENTQTALNNLNIDVKPEYITDIKQIAEHGIMSTPALIINDKTVSTGKLLTVKDIEKLINNL